jgi:hypothetical protein
LNTLSSLVAAAVVVVRSQDQIKAMAVVVVQVDIAQVLVYLLRQEIHTLSPLVLVAVVDLHFH